MIRPGRKCDATQAWASYGQLHHVSFNGRCCSNDGQFGVCSDIVEGCSTFVCGEMIMAQADDKVSGKNEPTKMPTRTSAVCSHMCVRAEGTDGLLTQKPYI